MHHPPSTIHSLLSTIYILLLAVPAARHACADLAYTQVSRRTHRDVLGNERLEVLTQKVFACRYALRSEDEASGLVNIVRLDTGAVYQLDPQRRVYAEARLEDMKAEVENYKRLLREHYRQMSDDKKRRLAVILGKARPRVNVLRSAEDVEVAGAKCRKASLYENGMLRLELWLTDAYQTPADVSRILEATGEFSGALVSERRRLGGFAMKERVQPLLAIHPQVENEVTAVTQQALPPEMFAVPQDFQKVPSILEADRHATRQPGQPQAPPQPPKSVLPDAPMPD